MLLNDYIIVERYNEAKSTSKGGFVRPTVNNNLGKVIECGTGLGPIEPGCLVYFLNEYQKAFFNNQEVFVMKKENIFKVLQNGVEQE